VQLIIKYDNKAVFKFASLQSEFGQSMLAQFEKSTGFAPNSILLIVDEKIYIESTAALKIASKLRFPFPLLSIFMLLPARLRDFVYTFIARNRYAWFGKKESCMVPTPDLRSRFIQD